MAEHQILNLNASRRIAYHRTGAQAAETEKSQVSPPGIVFLGGLMSDMTGTKAVFLENWSRERGLGYLRFDYTGHGESSGRFEETTILDWARDAVDAIDSLTEGPQVLVGSSMGGWAALLAARVRPERIAGLVGIAAAPDFTEDLIWERLAPEARETFIRTGRLEEPSDYSDEPYVTTLAQIEAGREALVLREPLRLNFPVRLLHGSADADVPLEIALRLLCHLESPDARLTILKDAGHRMSAPAELELLAKTVAEVVGVEVVGV